MKFLQFFTQLCYKFFKSFINLSVIFTYIGKYFRRYLWKFLQFLNERGYVSKHNEFYIQIEDIEVDNPIKKLKWDRILGLLFEGYEKIETNKKESKYIDKALLIKRKCLMFHSPGIRVKLNEFFDVVEENRNPKLFRLINDDEFGKVVIRGDDGDGERAIEIIEKHVEDNFKEMIPQTLADQY